MGAKFRFPFSFAPKLLPTLSMLAAVPGFVALGLWQWHKAERKMELQSLLDARSREPAVSLPAAPADADALRYRTVAVRGHYEPQYQILIDNRVHQERAGYHVVTPLRVEGSETRVLVNRGWVEAPAEHARQPEIATPTGTVELKAVAVLPPAKFFVLAAEKAPSSYGGWQPVWQNLDLARYRLAVPFAVQPVVLQLDPESPSGFVRDWPRPDERIERHLGYAWQWFGFAVAAVALWIATHLRRR